MQYTVLCCNMLIEKTQEAHPAAMLHASIAAIGHDRKSSASGQSEQQFGSVQMYASGTYLLPRWGVPGVNPDFFRVGRVDFLMGSPFPWTNPGPLSRVPSIKV